MQQFYHVNTIYKKLNYEGYECNLPTVESKNEEDLNLNSSLINTHPNNLLSNPFHTHLKSKLSYGGAFTTSFEKNGWKKFAKFDFRNS